MLERRAVLECFYGPLWTPSDRAVVLEQAARHAANLYVYGPAGDPHTGPEWREPYTGTGAGALEDLVGRCHSLGVAAIWRVSPGAPIDSRRSIRIADPDERAVLRERLRDIARMGFDGVLLAFDDLEPELDPATASAFAADRHPIAAAQAFLANDCASTVGELGMDMLFCPTHYWGQRPSLYRQRIGELLAAEMVLCWTGPEITSRSVGVDAAETAAEQYQHRLFLWDNYPVNDWHGASAFSTRVTPSRLPLAPLQGRDPGLHAVLAGYGTNLALEPRLGSIAGSTALDWAAEGSAYDPQASFRKAVREVVGDAAEDLLIVADAVGSLPVGMSVGSLATAAQALLINPKPETGAQFRGSAERLVQSCRRLRGVCAGELDPWLEAMQAQCSTALAACEILTGGPACPGSAVSSLRATTDWTTRSVADGLLFPLVQRAIGLAGAAEPPWPDIADRDH